ncbi:MAG: PEGA domain-containing protein [Candidatus Delongbacteria bacterium]|nr:PEGA domain-containing protein [Candidatus Delongbacteria bacterium]
MTEFRSPIYIAGEGFLQEDPPERPWPRRLLVLLVLAILAAIGWFWLRPVPMDAWVQVESDPPGADILLDLESTGLKTPARLPLGPGRLHGVQVQSDGFLSRPLVWAVISDTLNEHNRRLTFLLSPRPPAPELPDPDPQPAVRQAEPERVVPPQDRVYLPFATPLRDIVPVYQPEREIQATSLRLRHWDERYRCRLNGQSASPDALGHLSLPRASQVHLQVDLAQTSLLDTLLRLAPESGELLLDLPERNQFVLVHTEPVAGDILLGDRVIGSGEALLPRTLLPQQVRFARVSGYLEPSSRDLGPAAGSEVLARYLPEQGWSWQAGRQPEAGMGAIRLLERGVWFEESGFRVSAGDGPETRGELLRFGRARNDRRPWGCQQAVFEVQLPSGVHTGMPARLELTALDTGDNFPMSIKDFATLTVLFNGVLLASEVTLESEGRPRSWPVSNYLREGSNRIELRGSEKATSWAGLRSLRLELKR